MKSLPLALLLVASPLAMASELPNPIATLSSTNGTVAPAFFRRTECKVYEDKVVVTVTGPQYPGKPVVTQTAYTAEVKNAAAVRKLTQSAEKGAIAKKIPKIGAGQRALYGVLTVGAGAPKKVLLSDTGSERVGKAAEQLKAFVAYNCEQQN